VNPSHLYDRTLAASEASDRAVQPESPIVPLRLVSSRER
jgi:hypothetical protein